MPIHFQPSESLTLGAEIEVQVIDGATWDLSPSSIALLEEAHKNGFDQIQSELFQSMIELKTGICQNAHEVESDLRRSGLALLSLCKARGLRLAATGSHPFALCKDRLLYPHSRYYQVMERAGWIARRLAIFGVHVHLGMRSGDECIQMMNRWLHCLPHLLAITASSPFWEGDHTGLASARGTIFESIPTGGHPCHVADWGHFERLVGALTKSKSISVPKDLWWDVRPSPDFGTLEIRICDGTASLPLLSRVVALIHAISDAMLSGSLDDRVAKAAPDWFFRENKWRAAHYGLDAHILSDISGNTVPLREDLKQLLERLDPNLAALGYGEWITDFHAMVSGITSSDRQVQVFRKTKSLVEVVRYNVAEFEESFTGVLA